MNDSFLIALVNKKGLLYTQSYGESWKRIPPRFPWRNIDSYWVDRSTILARTKRGRYWISTNNGFGFRKIRNIPSEFVPWTLIETAKCIIFLPFDLPGLIISSDAGVSWHCLPGHGSGDFCFFQGIEKNSTSIFAWDFSDLFMITDDATKLMRVGSGLPDGRIRDLISSRTLLFAGIAGHGVYVSYDNGYNWKSFGLELAGITVVHLDTSDSFLYALTEEDRIWRFPLSSLSLPKK